MSADGSPFIIGTPLSSRRPSTVISPLSACAMMS